MPSIKVSRADGLVKRCIKSDVSETKSISIIMTMRYGCVQNYRYLSSHVLRYGNM